MRQPQTLIKNILNISIQKLSTSFQFDDNPSIIDELVSNNKFIREINCQIQTNDIFITREFTSIYQFYVYRNLLYYLIRQIKPKIVVETGVFHGLTTAWILQALMDNKSGRLISIDLPRRDWNIHMGSRDFGPGGEEEKEELKNEEPGWIVPDYLRDNWELILGPSEIELQKVIKENQNPDIFIHDSDHSYETMKFECEYIRKKSPKSLLVIDDYNVNNYTYELLIKGSYDHILMDDVGSGNQIVSSSAFLKPNFVRFFDESVH